MLEQWQQRFVAQGEVTVHLGRRRALLTAVGSIAFVGVGIVLLATEPRGMTAALGGLRGAVAVLAVLFFGGTGLMALRSLRRPLVVVRLDRDGITVPMHPPMAWADVTGVGEAHLAGQVMTVVETTERYAERAGETGGGRGRLARMNAAIIGPQRVALRPGAEGGDEAVAELLRWAHRRVGTG